MPARPTSNEAKKAQGTYTPARERKAPRLRAATPDMPAGLPESAQIVWNRVVPELAAARILAKVDHGLLLMYCVEEGRFEQSFGVGMSASDKNVLRLLRGDLGLGPTLRLKATVLEDEPEDQCKPEQTGGNVVSIAGLRSSMRKTSAPGESAPVGTSSAPASDS